MGEHEARSTLLAFNTVERLLRGDYFHSIGLDELTSSLADYPPDWPICGIGTTNWYRRNGELIVDGRAGRAGVWWADPDRPPDAGVVDLTSELPFDPAQLTSPSLADPDAAPRLPFVAVGVGDPATVVNVPVSAKDDLHTAVVEACADGNIGLAAVRASLFLDQVDHQTVCHLPLGGVGSLDSAEAVKGTAREQSWRLSGIYACNPTVQTITSVGGSPLHLHGYSSDDGPGGHVRSASAGQDGVVEVFPLRDLVLRIHELDSAWLPVRALP